MPIKQLISVQIEGDEQAVKQLTDSMGGKPLTINLRVGDSSAQPEGLAGNTKVDALRWEPVIETCSYWKLSEALVTQFNSLSAGSALNEELQALLRNSKLSDDHVLLVSYATNKDQVIGWCIFNAWKAQTENQAILLVFVSPEWKDRKVEPLIFEAVLQEATSYDYVAVVTKGMTLNIPKTEKYLIELGSKYEFNPSPIF